VNRIDRLHAILTHLQSKKLVTAQEMADRFDISLRTVYRDVKALDESGVPVIGEAGTGYTIMEGYRLPPVMFSQEEASALMLGSKLAEQFTDGSVKKHFNAALFKIKAVLRSTDKEYVDNLTDHIAILNRRPPDAEPTQQCLSLLQQAVANKRVVQVSYHSSNKDETTRRDLEPFGLLYYSSAWHLIAWCRMRNGYRDFRLSRMISAILKDEVFDGSTHPSVHDYLKQMRAERELQEVVILVDKTIINHLKEQKFLNGFVSEEDMGAHVSMKFLTSSLDYFARWLLAYTDKVKIQSPEPLQVLMKDLCEQLYTHYRG
jgi:predicted DNA-binding transcriptional regulator YafY